MNMMKQISVVALLSALAGPAFSQDEGALPPAVEAAESESPPFGEPSSFTPAAADLDDAEVVAAVIDHIESIGTMQGAFRQIGPDGTVDTGAFFIRRPGRLRFEYDAPNPLLVVADGSWVVLEDTALETVDRYPLRATPLKVLLAKEVDLDQLEVVAVERLESDVVVIVRATDEETQGVLSIGVSWPDKQLTRWAVQDAQGLTTFVELSDVERDMSLDPRLFVVEDKRRFTKN